MIIFLYMALVSIELRTRIHWQFVNIEADTATVNQQVLAGAIVKVNRQLILLFVVW